MTKALATIRQDIIDAYQEGARLEDIADRYGHTTSIWSAAFKVAGVPTRQPGPRTKLSPDDAKESCKLYLSNTPARQIARRYGVSHETIYNTLRSEGIALRAVRETG